MNALSKRVLFILGASILTLGEAALGQQPNPLIPQASQYRSSSHGFVLTIPAGWVLTECPYPQIKSRKQDAELGADVVLIATEQPLDTRQTFNTNMTIAVRNIPEVKYLRDPREIAEFAGQVLESLSS